MTKSTLASLAIIGAVPGFVLGMVAAAVSGYTERLHVGSAGVSGGLILATAVVILGRRWLSWPPGPPDQKQAARRHGLLALLAVVLFVGFLALALH